MMLWYLGLSHGAAGGVPDPLLHPDEQRSGCPGTYLSMILVLQTLTVPFSIWLMKSFIDEVPKEIEEAAQGPTVRPELRGRS